MSRTNFDEPTDNKSLADMFIQSGIEYRKRQEVRLKTAQVVASWLARKMRDSSVHESTRILYCDAAESAWKGLHEAILFGVYPPDQMLTPLQVKEQSIKVKGQGKGEPDKIVLVLKVRDNITDKDLLDSSFDETLIQLCAIDTATQFRDYRIADVRRLTLRDECLGQFPDVPLPGIA